jgi:PDZ domain-containing secreted protein
MSALTVSAPAELHLAKRMSRLGTETAFEVLVRARALEKQGKNIVHLEIGEPDFDTPKYIRQAAAEALEAGFTHYGPSAGLAFTLAIIDDLTPGNLTGGKRVAVTGTITSDGLVGPVGGVEQKAITARHNGVSLMIVPKSELKDARQGAGNIRVVGVDTIDEALAALEKAGGSPVPPASPVAARS